MIYKRFEREVSEMKRRILLTGGTGFVGSFLAYRLLQEGYKIFFLARRHKSQSAKKRIDEALGFIDPSAHFKNQYEVIEGDITKYNLGIKHSEIKKIQGQIDEVWHLAASISFREENSDKTYKINVEGTKNVLEFTAEMKIHRFQYFSTVFVCGNRLGRVYEDELDCGQKFRNPYERTKFEAEKLIKEWEKKHHLETSIYRLSIVTGDSQSGKTLSFTGYYTFMRGFYVLQKRIYQRLRKNKEYYRKSGISATNGLLIVPARVPCFPQSTINITTIDYVVEMLYRLTNHKESIGKTFHVANQNPPQFVWLFDIGAKILGITGFQLINIKNSTDMSTLLPGARTSDVLRKIESDILYACGEYLPYISGEPVFDDSNMQRLLGHAMHPSVTKKLVERLLGYAMKTDFGKSKHQIIEKRVVPFTKTPFLFSQPDNLKTKCL